MKIYLEIFKIAQDHAHGNIVIMQPGAVAEIVIPLSMPVSSFQSAVKNGLMEMDRGIENDLIAQSTLFLSPSEIGK